MSKPAEPTSNDDGKGSDDGKKAQSRSASAVLDVTSVTHG